ncbi:multicopper oxidase family protein [Cryobacterium tagatosivorans]|uniref:Copper-containing nitrite reductase n=1 Tax=Cryobacterium tagatosivorans TaxID=1259199 RepID=A0A4R8UD85_9MICO|nr:multicopper oxidase family protein [Cryobacterium tagatosivorans]TFB47326.1 multicopper oxidase family protein [Cryobacterium tagatosivorans]
MQPISRRGILLLGGLGVAATAVGGAGLLWGSTIRTPPGPQFAEPAELASEAGRLRVRLTAAGRRVRLGGRDVSALSFNGGIPGPTLRLKAGDRLSVRLRNALTDPTNLHVHGLHVSPEGAGDNPFVMVEPGDGFAYEYELPADHPPGVYWYHPHHHGTVADQVSGGLYGAIIVEDPEPIEAARERMLLISDVNLDGSGRIAVASPMARMLGREGEIVLVNGQVTPRLSARPGERERWRVVNTCVSRYLRLRLDGQRLQLVGIDSGRFRNPLEVEEVLLAPGNRADLLVTTRAGTASLRAAAYDRGGAGGMMGGAPAGSLSGAVLLATLAVSGDAVAELPAVSAQPTPRDLRSATVTARRELSFAMGMGAGMGGGGMMSFTINGRQFDAGRVDTTVQAGSVEEWTLVNDSPMDHPVHLHVWPMQLMEENGRDAESVLERDVVNVPARGRVVVRIAFDDFAGRSVYHCHILDHEDNGMMGVIEVR